MKILTYLLPIFFIGALASCSNNNENHNHEAAEETSDAHNHDNNGKEAHQSDEIVFHPEKAERFGIKTTTLQLTDFNEIIKVSGQIEPAKGDDYIISATKPGIIRLKNGLNEGYTVAKGETIGTISANELGGDETERAKIAFETAKREYERLLPLYKEKIVSERDFNIAKENYEQAKNAFNPTNVTPSSSIHGVVTKLYVKDGEYVETGMPIAYISQNANLVLRADMPQKYANALPFIHSANFKPSYSDSTVTLSSVNGKLISSNVPSATPVPGYTPVYFQFRNSGNFIANSYAEVYLIGSTKHNVLTVPLEALTEEQGEYFVYEKVDAECYKKHLVAAGFNDGKNVEILSGLKPGMEIVTQGAVIIKMAANTGAVPGHTHQH